MRPYLLAHLLTLVAVLSSGCGGRSGEPPTAPATPAPMIVRDNLKAQLFSATLPSGSTVQVAPMFATGQQAQELRFQVRLSLNRDMSAALVRAWVRTDAGRCMGGGAIVSFQSGVEREVQPASMSNPGTVGPVCALPYTTTQVEFEVLDLAIEERFGVPLSFPAVYHFVAAR